MNQYPRILAVDYGTQRIGLAISYATLAEPLLILQNDETVWSKLEQIVKDKEIESFLVGVSENEMADQSKQFAEKLKQHFQLPIELFDETLSSAAVHEKLHQKNMGKKQYTGDVDHYAAAQFLQDYLDEQALG
jgi:putative Holliday junction resolvase